MKTLTWPAVVFAVAVLAAVTVLGVTHIVDRDWIERTLSAVLGLVAGFGIRHAMGAKP